MLLRASLTVLLLAACVSCLTLVVAHRGTLQPDTNASAPAGLLAATSPLSGSATQ